MSDPRTKLKRFNLNADTVRSDLLHGAPVVIAAILFTFVMLMLLSSEAKADESPPTAGQRPQVELNSASIYQLVTLPGIGAGRARDIIDYRRKRPFKRPSDLLRIRGIGRRTYLRLKPLVRVDPNAPPAP